MVKRFSREEEAASAVEYALLIAFISLGVATAVQFLGQKLSNTFFTVINSLSTSNSNSGGCFIATAAYGSPQAQEVVLLQGFRDQYLSRHALGEKFIRVYYRFSPHVAGKIRHHQVLRLLARSLLTPIILLIKTSCRHPRIS